MTSLLFPLTHVYYTAYSGKSLASFPGLPHFFALQFAFGIIHGSRRAVRGNEARKLLVQTHWNFG